MTNDELANKVLIAVQGKPEATKAISDALAGGDPNQIQGALSTYAGVEISAEEAQAISAQVKADPSQPAAYCT
ncbi:MAG: hypothetical protein U0441_16320 [Polyangiaceae bacterium]